MGERSEFLAGPEIGWRLRQAVQGGEEPAMERRKSEINRYYVATATFLVSLALILLTIVDMRRAFLFPALAYPVRLGAPSPIFYFSPRHLLILLVGGLGAGLAYYFMTKLEQGLKRTGAVGSFTVPVALILAAILVSDLFVYRGVAAVRIAAAGKISVGQAVPLSLFPGWLLPVGRTINYFALVWHATLLGILLGALFLSAPLDLTRILSRKTPGAHIAGAALAVTQPFCSCCAAPVGAALYRAGAASGPALAFVVSSPMLNITSLALAGAFLPLPFVLLRVFGGLVVGVFLTYVVSLLAPAKPTQCGAQAGKAYRSFKWFQLGVPTPEAPVDTPAVLIRTWLSMAFRLAKLVLPLLFAGSLIATTLVRSIPVLPNDFLGVVVSAALGTVLMVPTWTEIPVALGLLQGGYTGTCGGPACYSSGGKYPVPIGPWK